MFQFLLSLRRTRKALRKAWSIQQASIGVNEEILRNAMGYAYEIGAGAPLVAELGTSVDNPFMNPRWRDYVAKAVDNG